MGNACSSGAVNAPKRGEWPRHPKQTHCLLCGTELWINRKGDPNKKFCNEKCACRYNMERKHGAEWKRQAAKEPCLKCHDALLMKSRMSAGMVAEKRAFVLDRRKRMGFDSTPIMSRASKHGSLTRKASGQIKKRSEKTWLKKMLRHQKMAWDQEWRGVIECWHAELVARQTNRVVYRRWWLRQKWRQDPMWCVRANIRARVSGIKRATESSTKFIAELGCTYWQAKQYIESMWQSGMTWANHGFVWEIDHIWPCSRFDMSDPQQRLQMSNIKNLQPLWKRENRSKAARRPTEFFQFHFS